jgi:ribonuclease BN (tRNA processing enzyme)
MIHRSLLLLAVLSMLSCSLARQPAAVVPHSAMAGTQVVLLGTGMPKPDPERSGPALAIVVNGQAYLVDCGAGVCRRAEAARRAGIEALVAKKLTHVFITHLHTDHTLGYPDLIFTPWVQQREVPLEAYGPPGLADMTEHILAAYEHDIHVRLHGLQPATAEGYKVNVHEIMPGLIYEDDNVRVTAFPVEHGNWEHALGFRFETADRTIVVSGDTTPCDSLIEHARGCDVLVHEVYSHAKFLERTPEWQTYHASFHTSTLELAEIAQQVQPKLLVLTHQLLWGATCEDLLEEIGRTYYGEVRCGCDLDVY